MKLENQVVSLELAREMKELGFKQKSLFWWQDCEEGTIELRYDKTDTNYGIPVQAHYSAYTVAELGEMFERDFKIHSGKTVNCKELYYCSFMESENGGNKINWFGADTEADARAKMLIYLKKNNLI